MDLIAYNENECLNAISLGIEKGKIAEEASKQITTALQTRQKDGIASITDLTKIDPVKEYLNDILEENVNLDLCINRILYKIINIDNKWDLPNGNYYNIKTKKFVIVNNNGIELIEYSPYTKSWKMYKNKSDEVLGIDGLLIEGYRGKIGSVTDEIVRDPSTGGIISYESIYENMIGKYDIGIGNFKGEIIKKYGDLTTRDFFGFKGNGIFSFDNGVKLIGNFEILNYLNTKKIWGIGKLQYSNGTEEIGNRGGESGLFEKIYKMSIDDSF